jgi:hypothetical protein
VAIILEGKITDRMPRIVPNDYFSFVIPMIQKV